MTGTKENSSAKWVVTDCGYNRAWCPDLIGKIYEGNPPSYVAVRKVM